MRRCQLPDPDSQRWVVCQRDPTVEAEPSGAQLFMPFLDGILGWINIFHPEETAEEGLLVSHPQHGPRSGSDSELIHSRRLLELQASSSQPL